MYLAQQELESVNIIKKSSGGAKPVTYKDYLRMPMSCLFAEQACAKREH